MGSAYSTIAADVLARYQRLRGRRVVFVTGTDEHGEKIAEAAARKQQLPQEHCNTVAAAFKDLWERVSCQHVHPVPQRLCQDLHRWTGCPTVICVPCSLTSAMTLSSAPQT